MVTSNYYSLTHEEKIEESDKFIQHIIEMLGKKGYKFDSNSRILDMGCGAGLSVYSFRKIGIRAYGVDIDSYYQDIEKRIFIESLDFGDDKIFHKIDINKYKFPFKNNYFDFCFSRAVFEHVMNYDESFNEIKRVLKPGGCSFHHFVSKYKLIEDHTYVPFSSVFPNYYYLFLWAFLGIKNEYQSGLSAREIAKRNYEYLKNNTNYLSKKQIEEILKKKFCIYSVTEPWIKNYDSHFIINTLIGKYYGCFKYRTLFFQKDLK